MMCPIDLWGTQYPHLGQLPAALSCVPVSTLCVPRTQPNEGTCGMHACMLAVRPTREQQLSHQRIRRSSRGKQGDHHGSDVRSDSLMATAATSLHACIPANGQPLATDVALHGNMLLQCARAHAHVWKAVSCCHDAGDIYDSCRPAGSLPAVAAGLDRTCSSMCSPNTRGGGSSLLPATSPRHLADIGMHHTYRYSGMCVRAKS